MKASVVIVVKNEARYISGCLESLHNQTFQQFEIIIIDNGSSDGTGQIITSLHYKNINYYYEPDSVGIAELRNRGIHRASGEYIFFTDGDCTPHTHWIEEGVNILAAQEHVGVEGMTYYEHRQKITVSDGVTSQFTAGGYPTCNVAYTREILEKAGFFDPHFTCGHEDRDLAFRVLPHGSINFNPQMLVFHQQKKLSIRALFSRAKRVENIVYFNKKHNQSMDMHGRILLPTNLLIIICPPILLFAYCYRSWHDIVFGCCMYVNIIYQRILIWKSAIKNRIFVI